MPLILIAPLTIFLMLAIGVRGRRATANVALLGPLIAMVGVFFAGWALLARRAPHDVNYPWLDIPVASSGASQFWNFTVGVGIRISHASLLLVACALVISFLTLVWSRIGARGEPGPARYYGAFALLIFAAVGVLVSTDLLELYTFWGIGGVSTYLLMTHYWTDDVATRGARLALALPALTDLSLLGGIAMLYSRYGTTNIDGLVPILHITAGAGNRALLLAALLIFAGIAGRVGMFPLQGWLTGAVDTPPAAFAAIQGIWPLMAISLTYKVLPIMVSAGVWPLRVMAAVAAVSAIVVPLTGLAGFDARRIVTTAGIGITSLTVLAFARPQILGLAIVGGAGSGLARAALVLAVATAAARMRTVSLAQMGEGIRRLPATSSGLLVGGLGLAFLTVEMAAQSLGPDWYVAYAVGIVLVVFLAFRVYFTVALGPLARRRGFEPNRIRESGQSLTLPSLVLGALAIGLALAAFSTRFMTYVDGKAHLHPPVAGSILWLIVPLIGLALAFLLHFQQRALGDRLTAAATHAWARVVSAGLVAGRFLVEPALRVAGRLDADLERAGENRLGGALSEAASVTRLRPPIAGLLVGLAVLLMLVAGLLVPGVIR